MVAVPQAAFGNAAPVAYLSMCSFAGCKAPVQFLSVHKQYVVPMCREHGLADLEAELGRPVVFAGPLGFISAEDPEPPA